jgi:hypothetical protein
MMETIMKGIRKLFIVIFLIGCGATTVVFLTSHGVVSVSAGLPPASIRISASNDHAKIGEKILLNIDLTNTSNQPLEIDNMPPYVEFSVYVQKGNGDEAPKTENKKMLERGALLRSRVTSSLGPGKTKSSEITLNDVYDLRVPGTYLVRVSRGYDSPISSNLIRVTITQ